jgi:hypothetical protein
LRRTAGRNWMRVAEDRAKWREVVCPEVDCSGLMMIGELIFLCVLVYVDVVFEYV